MSYYGNIREEELKLKVGEEFFRDYDRTAILGNVDFCVASRPPDGRQLAFDYDRECFLWAESKRGTVDLLEAFTQLVLTIGKARTFDRYLPPAFLGAFDADKFGLIPYSAVIDVFYQNDFNWNVTPSDHSTREFALIRELIEKTIRSGSYVYQYATDSAELAKFIKDNFRSNVHDVRCIRVSQNNFVSIYLKWRTAVMPTIALNWDAARQKGILDADFYLADLLSEHDLTLKDKLNVVLRKTRYELNRRLDDMGLFNSSSAEFTDNQAHHIEFWNKYIRPPKRDYWDYIIARRDLLIPQDVRERKGSFFTPAVWVAKAQEYLAAALGENWQEEYFIWDCCAGTGNLEAGLVNKYNVWASTLDKSDVDVMQDRIANGANLLPSHVFQFDFLNGDFNDLPQGLKDIINSPERRRKLVIFINPPYAEHGNLKQLSGTGKNKEKVATENKYYHTAHLSIGQGARQLYAQFLWRIFSEINGCIIGSFSKIHILQMPQYVDFRKRFQAHLISLFLMPANTFDNVSGQFPIGFFIWDTSIKDYFREISATVFNSDEQFVTNKLVKNYDATKTLMHWITETRKDSFNLLIGFMNRTSSDFQNNNYNYIINDRKLLPHPRGIDITDRNLIKIAIFVASKHCIEHTWLNDCDQYLWPNDGWQLDTEFQSDCLAYTIFSRCNNIKSADGVNHWIPFVEAEVNAQDRYESHFLLDFIAGKWHPETAEPENAQLELLPMVAEPTVDYTTPISFSHEASAVFDAARPLWQYYHSQPNANPNASFYDIREFFQGRNARGVMNPDSPDATYTTLLDTFKAAYKALSDKIAPKIYDYGFLMK